MWLTRKCPNFLEKKFQWSTFAGHRPTLQPKPNAMQYSRNNDIQANWHLVRTEDAWSKFVPISYWYHYRSHRRIHNATEMISLKTKYPLPFPCGGLKLSAVSTEHQYDTVFGTLVQFCENTHLNVKEATIHWKHSCSKSHQFALIILKKLKNSHKLHLQYSCL